MKLIIEIPYDSENSEGLGPSAALSRELGLSIRDYDRLISGLAVRMTRAEFKYDLIMDMDEDRVIPA